MIWRIVAVSAAFFAIPVSAMAECTTIEECAQEAVEAALTAQARIELIVPKGAVIAFNAATCPSPFWREYRPAYGRFVRGIDRSNGVGVDPEKNRQPGDLQEAAVGKHQHEIPGNFQMEVGGGFGATPHGGDANRRNPDTDSGWVDGKVGQEALGDDNRPANVALLYCERI